MKQSWLALLATLATQAVLIAVYIAFNWPKPGDDIQIKHIPQLALLVVAASLTIMALVFIPLSALIRRLGALNHARSILLGAICYAVPYIVVSWPTPGTTTYGLVTSIAGAIMLAAYGAVSAEVFWRVSSRRPA